MPPEIIGRSDAPIDRPLPEVRIPEIRHLRAGFTAAPGDPVALSAFTAPLWRRRKTLLLIALIGILCGGLISIWSRPVYRAHTSVQVESFQNDLVTPISATVPNASAENYLQNQVKILESDTLALRVADMLGDHAGHELRRSPLDVLRNSYQRLRQIIAPYHESETERRIRQVREALGIRTTLQSQLIEISFSSYDPQMAARGANAARTALVNMNREAREQLVLDTTDWLNRQAAELKATVQAQNQRLQWFAQKSGLILAGNEGTVAQARTRESQDALARAEAELAAKQSRYETATDKGYDLPSDGQMVGPLHQYQLDLENMRRELAQLQTIYTPTNYKVVRLQAQIAETERALAAERAAMVTRLGSEYAAASRLEKLLSDANSNQLKRAEEEMANDRQYNVLKSESDATEKLYETVLEKAKEAGAASSLHATNIRTIDAALVPSIPYSPRTPLNLAVGFGVGLLGGIGFVLLSERSDKVKRPGEIRVLDIPELGAIPSARDSNDQRWSNFRIGGRSEVGLVTYSQRTSILSESFRDAMTSIIFGAARMRPVGRPGGRVLVITSMDPMEGKTTVLTNLGVVAAERPQRVLVVDADLRRPKLHQMFGVPNDRGLTDVLKRNSAAELAASLPVVKSPTMPGLSILPSGPVDRESVTLLHTADFFGFLDRCRKEFDLILIDTPPLSLYADARILGRFSDGVVVVVRANKRSTAEIKTACDRLRQDDIPVLGTILNQWRMDPHETRAYGRYQYPRAT